MVASKVKIEANRRNSLKSTGPKDTAVSRFNALKHGLTSEKIVVTPFEDKREYTSLLNSLIQDFKPQTTIEHVLIEGMASSLWRSRRIIRSEKAEIEEKILQVPIEFENDESNKRMVTILGNSLPNPTQNQSPIHILDKTKNKRKNLCHEKNLRPTIDQLHIRYESALEHRFYRSFLMLLKIQSLRGQGVGFVS